ncbi:aromatic amino acid ammonia-lyase [Methylobacillus caricis]|uniref:HAL/PAL/TAL family ammonia-lyase n=1 Tax=Methylobacillus caricis TaxID=1971611 RepID=UPI001D0007EC|nr:aromatic amino acid ammonia-lyase [Methylobacillus caricis]MCB5188040.1 aromatic amino acid ammonia-lyase [Methylobacillus caricis]
MNMPDIESPRASRSITIGSQRITIEDVLQVARHHHGIALSSNPAFKARIDKGAAFLESLLADNGTVYGVNTGYGDSCTVTVPDDLVNELPLHLTRYHGCGLGAYLDDEATLAVLVCRLNSLAQGYSGVRWQLLEQLSSLINHRILPNIPEEGSVGASGDLTPLSYVAAALIGEREVRYQGKLLPAAEVLQSLNIPLLILAPKEGLAIMNGTAVMTGLACLAWQRADYLTRLCCRITAMAQIALLGNRGHFDPRLFAAKPHAGQNEAAAWIFSDLLEDSGEVIRLQDRYSIRCAPHVIGVARDALDWMRRDIENELNSANDNPLIDPEAEVVLHGGHFYGGHIAFAMDSLKNAVANLADLMDRQLALLVDSKYNHGLPQNLSGSQGRRSAINHGFKAVQIGTSAWTAEALKLTMPASVFSRSTECHNQDKVSMGTIAARDCLRVLELTEQVAAALIMASAQGVTLRQQASPDKPSALTSPVSEFIAAASRHSAFLDEDRPLEAELRTLTGLIRHQHWELYPHA